MQVSNDLRTCRQSEVVFNSLFAAQPDNYHKAKLTAIKAPHNGDWLNVLSITLCGLYMEDDATRVAVGLRLGASLREPYQCTCSNMVNTRGNPGLSSKGSTERTLRQLPKRSYLSCSVTCRTAIDQRTCKVTSY